MTRLFFFVLCLLISFPTFAQDGTCKPGVNCSVQTLRTTGGSSGRFSTSTASLQVTGTVSTPSTFAADFYGSASTTATLNVQRASGTAFRVTQDGVGITTTLSAAGTLNVGDGTNAGPSMSFTADPDTGFYRIGANTIGAAANGTKMLSLYSFGTGLINGSSGQPSLFFDANSTTGLYAYSNNAVGVSSAGNASMILGPYTGATSFPNVARALPVDSAIGHLWWQAAAPSATVPAVDLAGHPHPVMERRVYTIDVGYESTATPTWLTGAPRVAGSTAAITVVDAAAAGASSMGSSPGRVSYRSSVTLASAGSISSLISSVAFVRDLGYAPRWCQKVGQFSAGTLRVWAGLASALPGSSATPATHHVSFRYSTGDGDAAWQACYGAGATSCTTTGVAPASAPGSYDLLCIDCREGSAACTWWVNGIARVRQTSSLPTNSMAPYYSVEARSANAATIYAGPVSVEVN